MGGAPGIKNRRRTPGLIERGWTPSVTMVRLGGGGPSSDPEGQRGRYSADPRGPLQKRCSRVQTAPDIITPVAVVNAMEPFTPTASGTTVGPLPALDQGHDLGSPGLQGRGLFGQVLVSLIDLDDSAASSGGVAQDGLGDRQGDTQLLQVGGAVRRNRGSSNAGTGPPRPAPLGSVPVPHRLAASRGEDAAASDLRYGIQNRPCCRR